MRFLSVVGARPQFVKLAPIDWELRSRGHEHLILHTGQHYDEALSDSFFEQLEIAQPTWNLSVGSAAHGAQTAQMLIGCEERILEAQPNWVICYGDTNSTVAAALAAVKLHIPIAHIEAGLRSFNRAMPEEHNRIVTDHLSDVLFAPTDAAVSNLANEGLEQRTRRVGDVMADVIAWIRGRPTASHDEDYFVATIHRAENTDDPERLTAIIDALATLPIPVRLFAHPRLMARAADAGIDLNHGSIIAAPAASYIEFMTQIRNAQGVITDSGGLQKEAYLLATPCTTVRTETEWTGTLQDGWNQLAGPETLRAAALRSTPTSSNRPDLFGNGRAAAEIIDLLVSV